MPRLDFQPPACKQSQQKQEELTAFAVCKHDAACAFKVHEPLRHKGYNTLRRCLRVRQNPPAYAAMGRAISFPCH